MIKKLFILIFACGCFASCDNKLTDKPVNSDTIAKQRETSGDTNSNQHESTILPVRTQSKVLCDDEKGIFADRSKVKKYGKGLPYNLQKTVRGDTTNISFELMTDCHGEKYSGDAVISNGKVLLGYFIAKDKDSVRVADCYCDYRVSYFIATKEIQGKEIKIIRGMANSPKR